MRNKITLLTFFLIFFSFLSLWAQPSLKVYINHQYWDGNVKPSISPNDTIEFRIENIGNSQYRFSDVAFEVVLRDKSLFIFNSEKENSRFVKTVNYRKRHQRRFPGDQRSRVSSDLILYPPDDFVINPQKFYDFSINPAFTIPCIRFKEYSPLSRVIVHVYGVEEVKDGRILPVDIYNLGYSKNFMRDGFSFWRGHGFK